MSELSVTVQISAKFYPVLEILDTKHEYYDKHQNNLNEMYVKMHSVFAK